MNKLFITHFLLMNTLFISYTYSFSLKAIIVGKAIDMVEECKDKLAQVTTISEQQKLVEELRTFQEAYLKRHGWFCDPKFTDISYFRKAIEHANKLREKENLKPIENKYTQELAVRDTFNLPRPHPETACLFNIEPPKQVLKPFITDFLAFKKSVQETHPGLTIHDFLIIRIYNAMQALETR